MNSGTSVIHSPSELKTWIVRSRKYGMSRMTQAELAQAIGRSIMSIASWENHRIDRIPKNADIVAIATACGVPEPDIRFNRRVTTHRIDEEPIQPIATSLDEEILNTGFLLSRHASAPSQVARNAQVFRARYGGNGTDESTLQAIGDVYGITRERIRQIVDKQLSFVPHVNIKAGRYESLVNACLSLNEMSLAEAEIQLRHELGGNMSLIGASDYGREILGRPLPIRFIQVPNGGMIVSKDELPDWFQTAISRSKAIIRHCGAVKLNIAWALVMKHHNQWIPFETFEQVIVHAPGFEWVDDNEKWFWFGPEGSANRVVARVIQILAYANRALDIEVLYGGLTRYSRTRDSDVSEESGIWPPIEIVHQVLAKSPELVCQQGDDFRLAPDREQMKSKAGVAEAILEELARLGGLASRSELHRALVQEKGINNITFSVALSISPLISQVDRSIYAIRGWPINAHRLSEAQKRVGTNHGPLFNFKTADVSKDGDVSWLNTLSRSSMTNQYAGLPRSAFMQLQQGRYVVNDHELHVYETRVSGLIRLALSLGATEGTIYRTTLNAGTRTGSVEILGQQDF